MAKPGWHVLTNISPAAMTATCAVCGHVKVIYKARKNEYRCWVKHQQQRAARRRRKGAAPRPQGKRRAPARRLRDRAKWDYRSLKGDRCVQCGFAPEHPCQLDVDHIVPRWQGGLDVPENLQTLCSNCHRLKSFKEREIMPPPKGTAPTLWE